jgi:hypothetical protein
MMGQNYRTFLRSATNWKQFGSARKITVDRNLTVVAAVRACDAYNKNRTARQIARGTKMEFESQ